MTWTFFRFDLQNLLTTQSRRVIIPVALIVAFSITLPVPGLPIIIAAFVASVTASYPFQADERGLLDTLYATAALTRRSVVVGRYLTLLVFGAAVIALATALTVLTAFIQHQSLGWTTVAFLLVLAFGVLAVAFAVQLPWFFALGYTKSRAMIYIPVAVISIAGFIAAQFGLLNRAQLPAVVAMPALTAVIAEIVLPLGAALLIASIVTTSRLYARREL